MHHRLFFCSALGLLAICLMMLLAPNRGHAKATASLAYPLDLTPLQNVVQIGAGTFHTCALSSDGGVKCWGHNGYGQLGNGKLDDSPTPVAVVGLSGRVSSLAIGKQYTCALTDVGGVLCWGNNENGQLGDGSTNSHERPVAVTGLSSGVGGLTAGGYHTCAVLDAGGVKCWGSNYYGQLGDNTTIHGEIPVAVVGLSSGISGLDAGGAHTCVVVNGGAQCWGVNDHGQLGDGTAWRTTPADVVEVTTSTGTLTPTVMPTIDLTPTATPTATSVQLPGSGGDVYEADDTCNAAHSLAADGNGQTHNFHQLSDNDWVCFQATTGVLYRVEVQARPGSPADVDLEIYSNCTALPAPSDNPSFSPNVRIDFKAPQTGPIYLRLTNHDVNVAGLAVAYTVAVRPLPQTAPDRVLIIVAGRLRANDRLQTNIHNVSQTVYRLFQRNGYTNSQIQLFASNANLPGFAGAASKTTLQAALQQAASQVVNGVLTLYLIDHGSPERFYLDGVSQEILTPDELNDWLNQVESAAPGVKVNVIIEACEAGSFINKPGSISKAGRVVLTSTNADNDAKASKEGAYFSDHLLTWLQQGFNLSASFFEARSAAKNVYSLQDAWLDSNGNGLANEFEDAALAAQRSFAYAGSLPGDEWPPHIFQAAAVTTGQDQTVRLRVDVRDDAGVRQVWAVVYAPGYTPPAANQVLQPEVLPTFLFTRVDNDNHWEAEIPGLTKSGRYQFFIHADDDQGLVARPVVVEVNTAGNNDAKVFLPLVAR